MRQKRCRLSEGQGSSLHAEKKNNGKAKGGGRNKDHKQGCGVDSGGGKSAKSKEEEAAKRRKLVAEGSRKRGTSRAGETL